MAVNEDNARPVLSVSEDADLYFWWPHILKGLCSLGTYVMVEEKPRVGQIIGDEYEVQLDYATDEYLRGWVGGDDYLIHWNDLQSITII